MERKCKQCGINIFPPKRKFCSAKCGNKWLYNNNGLYKKRIIDNAKRWGKLNPEKKKLSQKKAMKKYMESDNYKSSRLLAQRRSRSLTKDLCIRKKIGLKTFCNHDNNLEIHHEVYPTTVSGIKLAIAKDKIYLLCIGCHREKHKKENNFKAENSDDYETKMQIEFEKKKCNRCAHMWTSKKNFVPKSCPRCKSYTWDKTDNYLNSS